MFVGQRYQRGHDWDRRSADCSSVTSYSLSHQKILGNVVKTGMEVTGDVFSGKSAKEALKERGLSGIKKESRSKPKSKDIIG